MWEETCRGSVFVLLISGAVSAQTASSDAARTESLVSRRSSGYAAGLEASRVQEPAGRHQRSVRADHARGRVRRAVDKPRNGCRAAESTDLDFTLASLRANYNPNATSTLGRRDNVRPPTTC